MQRNRFPKHSITASLFAAGARFAVLSAAAQIDTGEPQILSAGQLNATLAPNGAHVQPLDPQLAENHEHPVGQAFTYAVL